MSSACTNKTMFTHACLIAAGDTKNNPYVVIKIN